VETDGQTDMARLSSDADQEYIYYRRKDGHG